MFRYSLCVAAAVAILGSMAPSAHAVAPRPVVPDPGSPPSDSDGPWQIDERDLPGVMHLMQEQARATIRTPLPPLSPRPKPEPPIDPSPWPGIDQPLTLDKSPESVLLAKSRGGRRYTGPRVRAR